MNYILNLIQILEWFCFSYLSFAVIYTLILSLGAFAYKDISGNILNPKTKIAIIVPAYKEDSIIINTIEEHLSLNYPKDKFHVFLAADSFKPETLEILRKYPITVIEVKFDISTVTKSVKEACRRISEQEYPYTLICDADNVLDKDFLIKINSGFQSKMRAIQGRRFTKNQNTEMAVLDSLSEIINFHLFIKGAYALGLSAALRGSGMAFETSLLKDCMENNESIGGYDRELHLALAEKGVRIHYIEKAICYDEKISSIEAFGNQRKRWLSSQFLDLRDHFKKSFQLLFTKGGMAYFQLGFLSNFFLPRVLNLGILFLFSFFSFLFFLFFKPYLLISPQYWILLLFIYFISLALGVPRDFYSKKLLKSIVALPKTFFVMFSFII